MWDEHTVGLLTRATARASAMVFASYLVARGLVPSRFVTGGPRARAWRRGLFVAFASAHTIHFGAVLSLAAVTDGANVAARGGWAVVSTTGALFYAGLLLMWRAERPGAAGRTPKVVRVLSRVAAAALWIAFAQAYAGRLGQSPLFVVLTVVLVAALASWIAGGLSRRPR